MTKPIDPVALFRLSVLGPLLHRSLNRGEFQRLVRELAERHYEVPGSRRTLLSPKTIAAWYYAYRDHGIEIGRAHV